METNGSTQVTVEQLKESKLSLISRLTDYTKRTNSTMKQTEKKNQPLSLEMTPSNKHESH